MKYLFNIKEPTEFFFELEFLKNGNLIFNMESKATQKYYYLSSNDNSFSVFLKNSQNISLDYFHKNLEIRMSLLNNVNPVHFQITVTDTRFPTQVTLLSQNLSIDKVTIKKDGKRLPLNKILPSLYESFKGEK